jgi:phosphate transport system permease protein
MALTATVSQSTGEAPSASPVAIEKARAGLGDRVFKAVCIAAASSLVVLAGAMVAVLFNAAFACIKSMGWGFLVGQDWNPVTGQFGALPFIYGTLATSLIAFAFAGPLGIGIALVLTEMAPRGLRAVLSYFVELLAAIPSIVFGLWGMFVLAPLMREHVDPLLISYLGKPLFVGPTTGLSLMTAAMVLTVMILPTVMSLCREVFDAVPSTAREAALALGATRWESIRMAVLAPTTPGMVGALLLGLGRALGETMAVTMVIGNRPEISANLLGASHSMAAVIANEFSEAVSDVHIAALAEIGLLLMGVTILLNLMARLLVMWTTGRYSDGKKGR